jgi:tRNA1Val (adenine37-N6)-methyltransferase
MSNLHDESMPLKTDHKDVSSLKREGETVDDVFGGQIKIIQKERGYRFSIDAYLLAHFVCLKKNDRVLDMGTGSGVISIIVAHRWPYVKVVGVDVQEDMVDMAQRSVDLNDLCDRIEIRWVNVRETESFFDHQSFDVAIFNPPYRKLKSGRMNRDYQKSVARHEIEGSLRDFLAASAFVLKPSGRVYIIYPASRTVELICQMRHASIEPKRMKIVHSHERFRGEFVLVEGIKAGREELEILPPLFIYMGNGAYSEAMTRLFRELSECN